MFFVGSIVTVVYIADLDSVFIEWVNNGGLTSFSKIHLKITVNKPIIRQFETIRINADIAITVVMRLGG